MGLVRMPLGTVAPPVVGVAGAAAGLAAGVAAGAVGAATVAGAGAVRDGATAAGAAAVRPVKSVVVPVLPVSPPRRPLSNPVTPLSRPSRPVVELVVEFPSSPPSNPLSRVLPVASPRTGVSIPLIRVVNEEAARMDVPSGAKRTPNSCSSVSTIVNTVDSADSSVGVSEATSDNTMPANGLAAAIGVNKLVSSSVLVSNCVGSPTMGSVIGKAAKDIVLIANGTLSISRGQLNCTRLEHGGSDSFGTTLGLLYGPNCCVAAHAKGQRQSLLACFVVVSVYWRNVKEQWHLHSLVFGRSIGSANYVDFVECMADVQAMFTLSGELVAILRF